MKQKNYKSKNFAKTFPFYDNSGMFKLKCSYDKFYNDKTNRNFITRYKKHISEIKF